MHEQVRQACLKFGSTVSWLCGLRKILISEPLLYLIILSTARVVLCMKSTYPQAQGRCLERPALASKEPFPTFPTSLPLTENPAENKPVTWPHQSQRPKSIFLFWQRTKPSNSCMFWLPEQAANGQPRVLAQPHPHCPRKVNPRENEGGRVLDCSATLKSALKII